MAKLVSAPLLEPPLAWREPMLLVYPHGGSARFDPRDRFFRPGDVLNGYVIDRFELDGETVLAFLRVR